MRKILLDAKHRAGLTIMIFAEGTVLKPRTWFSLYSFKSNVPIGNAAKIIRSWSDQGANIVYCTSRKKDMLKILRRFWPAADLREFLWLQERKKRPIKT